jgi:choline dehydrogenase-like flavoprotein
MSWDFWVRHYGSDELQRRDDKYREHWGGQRVDGVLYPRAGCLGGCTAHNAMVTVYPHSADWDVVAQLTGDASWSADNMRKYFEKMENCRHRWFLYRWLAKLGFNPTRHGWSGWLQTERSIPRTAFSDRKLMSTLRALIKAEIIEGEDLFSRIKWFIQGQADPNDWRLVRKNAWGIHYTPLLTRNHSRLSTRERLLEVQEKYPNNLAIELNALATRILFDQNNRAIGVEYLKGERLYQAHKKPSQELGERREAHAAREVILAGGVFNTPQLLMLSGIGPSEELGKHGIPVRVDLPGVGTNLQDHYEIGVVNRMDFDHWEVLEGAKFAKGDPQFKEWESKRRGVYTTNGTILAIVKRSLPERSLPDLFCFALMGRFAGYFPTYSVAIPKYLNYLTWVILKGHAKNSTGEVRLKSADPRERPYINFRYFEEGNDKEGEDLDSVVEGIKFMRKLTAPLKVKGLIAEEELPGDKVQSDDELRDFAKYQSWGHHASCTCPIGRDGDSMAVLDRNFKVRGIRSLRVVDASIFPRIPGFFIVSSVYIAAEKAAEVILAELPDPSY